MNRKRHESGAYELPQIKFRSAPGERKCAFIAKDDGLYVMNGMVILVK